MATIQMTLLSSFLLSCTLPVKLFRLLLENPRKSHFHTLEMVLFVWCFLLESYKKIYVVCVNCVTNPTAHMIS